MKDIHNIATKARQQKKEDSRTASSTDTGRVKTQHEWIKKQEVAMGRFMQESEMHSAFDRFPVGSTNRCYPQDE